MIIICCLTIFCTFNTNYVYAKEAQGLTERERTEDSSKNVSSDWGMKEEFNTDEWKPTSSTTHEEQKLKEIGNKIIGTIQVIGSIVSVIAIMIIGIRYMACSVEEKAQYKETMGPYFIGAVLVFGITTALRIVYDIAQSLN